MKREILTWKIYGSEPGPTVAIIGGVHGDEPVGVKAINQIVNTLKIMRGQVILIIANPPAVAANRRFIDVNLNRALISSPDENNSEGRLARKLMTVLDDCDALLDLHAGIGDIPPFAICEKDSLEIASYLPVSIVSTGWTKAEPGSTDAYMFNQGKPAICLECGNKNAWRENLPLALQSINIFLAYFKLLPESLPITQLQKLVDVRYAVVKNSDAFVFSRQFTNFERLKPGEIIARDDNQIYRAPRYSSCIIFPWPEAPLGSEAFLVGGSLL